MSYDINSVTVAGRLTKDVELQYSKAGKAYAKISIACQRDKENTDFFDCVIFGKTAEFLAKHTQKGDKLVLSGEMRQDRWEDQNGNKRSKVSILVNNVEIVPKYQQTQGDGWNADDEW